MIKAKTFYYNKKYNYHASTVITIKGDLIRKKITANITKVVKKLENLQHRIRNYKRVTKTNRETIIM